jgi:hypothetical protein
MWAMPPPPQLLLLLLHLAQHYHSLQSSLCGYSCHHTTGHGLPYLPGFPFASRALANMNLQLDMASAAQHSKLQQLPDALTAQSAWRRHSRHTKTKTINPCTVQDG